MRRFRLAWLPGIALLGLAGCASLEEQISQKIEFIIPVQQAAPGEVIKVGVVFPFEVKSAKLVFLGRSFHLFPRRDLREPVRTAFLPVPPETPAGDTDVTCVLETPRVRHPIEETVTVQILPVLQTPAEEAVTAKGYDARAYQAETAQLRETVRKSAYRPDRLDAFLLPQSGRVRSEFGARRSFNGQPAVRVDGIEIEPIAAGTGDVIAAAEGRVVFAQALPMYGQTVVIDHGYTYVTLYAHLQSLQVKPGQIVPRGGVLGRVGRTGGAATGTALLYQMFVAGVPVDAKKYTGTNPFR